MRPLRKTFALSAVKVFTAEGAEQNPAKGTEKEQQAQIELLKAEIEKLKAAK